MQSKGKGKSGLEQRTRRPRHLTAEGGATAPVRSRACGWTTAPSCRRRRLCAHGWLRPPRRRCWRASRRRKA